MVSFLRPASASSPVSHAARSSATNTIPACAPSAAPPDPQVLFQTFVMFVAGSNQQAAWACTASDGDSAVWFADQAGARPSRGVQAAQARPEGLPSGGTGQATAQESASSPSRPAKLLAGPLAYFGGPLDDVGPSQRVRPGPDGWSAAGETLKAGQLSRVKANDSRAGDRSSVPSRPSHIVGLIWARYWHAWLP